MSKLTVATVATGRASPVARPVRPPIGSSRRAHSGSDREVAVPLYTRHTRGTIEAERERRQTSHAGNTVRHVRRPGMPHPRIAAAIAARAGLATQSRTDEDRWNNEGGSFDPERSIGNREMKRCSS
jgi:hypothetical protein